MRRPLRVFFNALAMLALVLAVLVAGLGVRSYSRSDAIYIRLDPLPPPFVGQPLYHQRQRVMLRSDDGLIDVNLNLPRSDAGWLVDPAVDYAPEPLVRYQTDDRPWRAADIRRIVSYTAPATRRGYVPHAYVVATLTMVPTWWLWRWTRAGRAARRGLCPSCGYDLRATPKRCPECGVVPTGGVGMGVVPAHARVQ